MLSVSGLEGRGTQSRQNHSISLPRTKPMSYGTEMVSPVGSASLDLMNNHTYFYKTQQFVF